MPASILLMAIAAAASVFQQPSGYDPDRLPVEAMEKLVAEPMKHVRAGNIGRGVAELERLRAQTLRSDAETAMALADIDESFGVLVYMEGLDSKRAPLGDVALPFLERAVGSYRAAFGPAHPEVALALQSWADALLMVDRAANTATARGAYCEAFRIRLDTLGPNSVETGSALAQAIRLAPPGAVDPAVLDRLDPKAPVAAGTGDGKGLLLSPENLAKLRAAWQADRDRDDLFRTLASDQRLAALCPPLGSQS